MKEEQVGFTGSSQSVFLETFENLQADNKITASKKLN